MAHTNEGGKGSRILIVDDEPIIRALLSEAFRKAGFQVRTAADVPEAIALCGAEPFDAVLSDVRMPSMSGHDLVRWLAAEHPGTPTVLMSGCDLECNECPGKTDCFVLPKPFRPEQAVSVMRKALAEGSAA